LAYTGEHGSSRSERASAIGDLHRSGIAPNLAELLIDLEEVEGVRAMVREELLRLARGDSP
jgi:hypothetical protein